MIRAARVWPFAALTWAPFVVAQTTLGALLDAGAKPVTVAQFKEELVQRLIAGPTPTGGTLELMYTAGGDIRGGGSNASDLNKFTPMTGVDGEWRVDERGRICSMLRYGASGGGPGGRAVVVLPARCQHWFKLGDKYFLADSDTDRSAKVLSRTIKQ